MLQSYGGSGCTFSVKVSIFKWFGIVYATIALKLQELSRTVDHAKTRNTTDAIAIVRSNEGRNLMREIRSAVDEFNEDEIGLENEPNHRASLLRSILLLITAAAGIPAGLSQFWSVLRRETAQTRVGEKVHACSRYVARPHATKPVSSMRRRDRSCRE
jgi:hypothetical protein